ncbi:MAG: redox-sensing transcriptional repressor Rex [Chloracidobacterium sp.]|nr:redox-sensing transcriptional repressor Rex [Chloracidobacterium sp.]
MKSEKISELTTNRLSVYLRCLNDLAAKGAKTVSSKALAEIFHLNSAQIRKDLAYFGEFGVRGVGYRVEALRDHLTHILGLDKEHRVCIIGAGRLGTALTDYYGFKKANFTVAALFDADPKKIGKKIGNVEILDIKNFAAVVKRDKIEVAVIAVPAANAQNTLERVTKAGIKAVMNFAPVALKASKDVKLKTIDLTTSLESLSYFLAQPVNQLKPKAKSRRKQ